MGKVYRERIEIVGSILQAALKPSTRYELYLASNTSYKGFAELRNALLVTGDIVEIQMDSKEKYKTSSRGSDLLRKINNVKPNIERIKKALETSRI